MIFPDILHCGNFSHRDHLNGINKYINNGAECETVFTKKLLVNFIITNKWQVTLY